MQFFLRPVRLLLEEDDVLLPGQWIDMDAVTLACSLGAAGLTAAPAGRCDKSELFTLLVHK
jgi:hypothetical protein